ncbi:hypothetical protein [Autumnicola musiva]|uniref:DUF2938 domain-containing protein n=1 Tax=Autumnicola musiva TaxID=3075589 RepID=A0ABU3D1L3_9FLAO|nr:hypothetical protein [Zunongwangia sp. F117]MDT0675421.1 hypothetical protein [Zunongwangia sp. F117]
MNFYVILFASVISTSVMTIFTYICAAVKRGQFRPPELLNMLISRSSIFPVEVGKTSFAGWIIHYSIGFFFVVIFSLLWNFFSVEISLLSGIIFGFGAGLIGIGGWKIMFVLNENPPEIELKSYFLQLLLAHILFGISASLVFMYGY